MKDILAVDGGKPFMTRNVAEWPVYGDEERKKLNEVLESGHWGCLAGSKVNEFEKVFAEFQEASYGICVPNGTVALEMALKALDIGIGDEVITTPYTFIATVSAIINSGARPVFVDIDPKSYLMDLDLLELAITEKTKAIMPVHLGGRPVNMETLGLFATKHSLRIIEDACQAWGSEWNGRRVGALGDLGAFSFQSSKNITAGEGGIVVTNDEDLADVCWSLHNVGRVRGGMWYQHERIAWNFRMTEWQGAILLAQLERYSAAFELREKNSANLRRLMASEIKGLVPLEPNSGISANSNHLFIMKYNSEYFGGRSRDLFVESLRAEGVESASSGYVPLHQNLAIKKALAKFIGESETISLPVAEQAGQETVWLGQTEFLGDDAYIEMLIGAIRKIQKA